MEIRGLLWVYHNNESCWIVCDRAYANYLIDVKKIVGAFMVGPFMVDDGYRPQEPVTGQHAMEKACQTGMYSPKWWRL